MNHDFDK